MILGSAPMEGRIGDDGVHAGIGQVGQSVTPVGDDVQTIRRGGAPGGVDGLPRHIGGVRPCRGQSACQLGSDDAVATSQVDDVGAHVRSNVVQVGEQQRGSGVQTSGVEHATVGVNRQPIHGVATWPCAGDRRTFPRP